MKIAVKNIIGFKELRNNADKYIKQVKKGRSFVVLRKLNPIFKISSPLEDTEIWEKVIDFSKIKKSGVSIKELLKRL